MEYNKLNETRKLVILDMIRWYWDSAMQKNLIHKSDYEFLYNIWESGIDIYSEPVRDRLNELHDIYRCNVRTKTSSNIYNVDW